MTELASARRDKVRVIQGDGLAETTALLRAHAIGAASLVHVDPFDFRAAGPGAVSALELVTCLSAASIPTFVWYGLTAPSAAHQQFHEVTIAAHPWLGPGVPICVPTGGERMRRASARPAASCSQPQTWLRSGR